MNNLLKIVAATVLMINGALAQVKWSADPAHTNARFDVNHLGISFVDGEFTKYPDPLMLRTKRVLIMQN
ncbi:hypothetical protein [Sphingobacterium sp. IITKGP-BTPF85]|uniref:hypothetical protein n=1 Tax=Sphingobacterium sp. IITKGP-BTPF85 TaxID=1338009 RepID=UPI0003FC0552|nr:hypothetical protein [Sphingobacterium sp. IITKGP-BTPF85]KKX51925.1 hypothetical protein L950_0202900 [Sphingobacterium sp. IITKGP-BTPF85]